MIMRTIVYLLTFFALSSCVLTESFVSFTRTKEGGLRVKKPKRLKFYGRQFHLENTSFIDTNAVYVFSNYELPGAQPYEISHATYCRFFPNGQVLFVSCDTIPNSGMVNNPALGWQGYYKIKNNRLKIREFEIINCGQIGLRRGHFEDGDILFYSNTPRTYFHSWKLMEKDDLKERWRKVKVDGIRPLQLDW
jgi:hypothetical protein